MRRERDEPRRRCPECGNVVPISDQVCMRCGHDLDFPDEAVPAR
jgi:rRNA maturation endonuclease Nob1